MTIQIVLWILAFVAFVLAALDIKARVNLMALGLALWVLGSLIR